MAAVGTGREEELRRLLMAGRDAADGHGAVIFLAGPTGSGKSFLLKNLAAGLADADLDARARALLRDGRRQPARAVRRGPPGADERGAERRSGEAHLRDPRQGGATALGADPDGRDACGEGGEGG